MWIVLISIGVFLGAFAYEKFTEYRLQRELQEMIEIQEQQTAIARQKRMADQERKRKAELYRNTACAINNDTNKCVCLHEKTGARITLSQGECEKRAKQITW